MEVAPVQLGPTTRLGGEGDKISLLVKPSDSLLDVTAKLEQATGVQAFRQRLFSLAVLTPELGFNRVPRFAKHLEDVGMTVGGYGLQAGAVLELIILKPDGSMPVLVNILQSARSTAETLSFELSPTDTVADVKVKI